MMFEVPRTECEDTHKMTSRLVDNGQYTVTIHAIVDLIGPLGRAENPLLQTTSSAGAKQSRAVRGAIALE